MGGPAFRLPPARAAAQSPRIKTRSQTILNDCGFLIVGLPAIFVLVVATSLFESSAAGGLEYSNMIRSASGWLSVGWERVLEEARARFMWFACVVLDLFISGFAVVYCGWMISRCLGGRRLAVVCAAAAILIAGGICFLRHQASEELALNRIVFAFTYDSLVYSGRYTQPFLRQVLAIISTVNVFGIVAPVFALLAMCSSLGPRPRSSPDDLDWLPKQSRRLKETLNVSAALMVAGILHMGAWLRWPASLLGTREMRTAVVDLVLSVTLFWGVALTCIIVVTYLPVASLLRARALRALEGHQEITDAGRWLSENGLEISPAKQLPQVAAMLAPLIAGPLSSLLGTFAGGLH